MKCFNHQYNETVGLCVECGKGLCNSCYKLNEEKLVCSEKCAEDFFIRETKLNTLSNVDNDQQTDPLHDNRNLALILIFFGIIFYITDSFMLASLFLTFGLLSLVFNKNNKN